jgi:hypothetical protein
MFELAQYCKYIELAMSNEFDTRWEIMPGWEHTCATNVRCFEPGCKHLHGWDEITLSAGVPMKCRKCDAESGVWVFGANTNRICDSFKPKFDVRVEGELMVVLFGDLTKLWQICKE